MFYLIGILAFLFIALRLAKRKTSKDLNHRKSFNIKAQKKDKN